VECGNCGKPIPPNGQVSVVESADGTIICHSTYLCSPAGNARYGFWGKGKLDSVFGSIEQC
jgi:hypothetical protein